MLRSFFSIHDLYGHLFAGALGDRLDDRADFLGNSALTADHLAHVLRCDPQLQFRGQPSEHAEPQQQLRDLSQQQFFLQFRQLP